MSESEIESERVSESAFWRFSLWYYQIPGIARACLAWQDNHGADVNILLFVIFLGDAGRYLSVDDIHRIDRSVTEWRARAVQPLRDLRRLLKDGLQPVASAHSEALRNNLKACELHAEQLQQEALERLFPVASVGTPGRSIDTVRNNISAYATLLGSVPGGLVEVLAASVTPRL